MVFSIYSNSFTLSLTSIFCVISFNISLGVGFVSIIVKLKLLNSFSMSLENKLFIFSLLEDIIMFMVLLFKCS